MLKEQLEVLIIKYGMGEILNELACITVRTKLEAQQENPDEDVSPFVELALDLLSISKKYSG